MSHKPRSTDRSKSGWKREARATKNTGRGLSAYHIRSVCVSVAKASLLTAFAFSSVSGWDWVEEHERFLFFPADMAAAGCQLWPPILQCGTRPLLRYERGHTRSPTRGGMGRTRKSTKSTARSFLQLLGVVTRVSHVIR